MRFVDRLLHQSGIPLTRRQFWQYAAVYWGFFGIISYWQSTMVWWITPNSRMYYVESLVWLLQLLYWWGATPLIIWLAQRYSFHNLHRLRGLLKPVAVHFFALSVLSFIQFALVYVLTNPAYLYESGQAITIRSMLVAFFFNFSNSFAQYLLLVAGYSIIAYIYRFQALSQRHLQTELANEQLKSQLSNAQLQALKMQLNPHFLFNTLHTIVSLMVRNQPRLAIDMVTALSDLLRGVLAHQHENFLPFKQELQLTQQYLAIQQIRFRDRLVIEYAIDPAVEPCLVPSLILQPLVENAITHGIADLTTDALIRITAREQDGQLFISVFDNGWGIVRSSTRKGGGLGLSNTLSRLQQAYGDAGQLRFDQPHTGTTTVTIMLPLTVQKPFLQSYDTVSNPVN